MSSIDQLSLGLTRLKNSVFGAEIEEFFDFVVAGTSPKPQDSLYETCREHAPTIMVGDAVAPRDAMMAFCEGDRAGRTV